MLLKFRALDAKRSCALEALVTVPDAESDSALSRVNAFWALVFTRIPYCRANKATVGLSV